MINPRRVKRIKNAIYIFLVLLILVPAILVLVLSIKMLRIMPELSRIVAEHQAVYVQVQGQSSPPRSSGEQAPDPQPSKPAQLPVPQGTSRVERASASLSSQPESSTSNREDTSQDQSHFTDSSAPEGQPIEPLPEQVVTRSPPYGDIQSPNTGLPR